MGEVTKDVIVRYETLLKEMWSESAKYLGILSTNLLVERVIWELSQEYPAIQLLKYGPEGISCTQILTSVEKGFNDLEEMFMKFITRYVSILAKLLGHERAEEIRKKIITEFGGAF
ncbi:MAG: hypothetical protein L5656_10285 [Thermanaeromonas sp.]|uniref:hypothetical protein n=1 Tax=Thermanaeromonas sp. TaxID=2003697 RepID=UPI002439E207|nr:hypothetical protein [Thermanaeromonas sp.]MCG0278893.1 hypothetical protein [Thermanaeromonas sp.]